MATGNSPSTSDPVEDLREELISLKRHLRIVSHHQKTIPLSISGFQLDRPNCLLSEPFYSHACGYKLCLRTEVSENKEKPLGFMMVIHTCLMRGEFDAELNWPVKARVTVQIQNQNGTDSDHIQRSKQISWQYRSLGDPLPIPVMKDVEVGLLRSLPGETQTPKYLVGDTLRLTVKYMPLE